jgi:hypothetical protein
MKFPTLACLAALSVSAATGPAFAGENSVMRIDLVPGGSHTIYVNGQEGSPALPVFRICLASPAGYSGALRMTEANKGPAYGSVEPMLPGQCLFASGEKLVVSLDTGPLDTGPAEEVSKRRATAWLTERIEAMRALPNPTEIDKIRLKDFEDRLAQMEASPVIMDVDAFVETQETIEELESKESRTEKETLELVWAQYKLASMMKTGGTFKVTLVPQ